ncbi:hypothetical protein N657DRAFT_67352 [Parathielavia appendiculata]|uniref:Uncharacterized protein n=1 Tax=Parathielavia appendiculata TaxID=2587402 RepID=A0AAN6Z8Y0_9PEZI|nr:hypothetical protein N657DRAFT_67352 [Parathielavia appendiculata]
MNTHVGGIWWTVLAMQHVHVGGVIWIHVDDRKYCGKGSMKKRTHGLCSRLGNCKRTESDYDGGRWSSRRQVTGNGRRTGAVKHGSHRGRENSRKTDELLSVVFPVRAAGPALVRSKLPGTRYRIWQGEERQALAAASSADETATQRWEQKKGKQTAMNLGG